jgi:kanamycin kinase
MPHEDAAQHLRHRDALRPDGPPPPELTRLAPGWTAAFVYRLVPGVTTWRMTAPEGGAVRYAKVDSSGRRPTLRDEADRMAWAAANLPVPGVVALQQFGDTSVLLTDALPGRNAVDPSWRHDLPALVSALGRGLRAFHDAVGAEGCPFRFEIERALEHVARRVAAGEVDPTDFHECHAHLSPTGALAELRSGAPDVEDLVVCHGDPCPPNFLLEGNAVTGYVDLGELGVSDRWSDVAVGAWSVGWNFGPELEPLYYESYGIDPDPERIRYYRLLYDLVS